MLGADGLLEALREAGLVPVPVGDADAVAIVSGYAPEVRWKTIMRAAVEIRNGLPWVATNTDPTLPTGDGPAPGHGTLVKMISDFAGVQPRRWPASRSGPCSTRPCAGWAATGPLMVGDSLHTDIAGAHHAGTDSLLVMTGVTALSDLVAARPDQRPTWVGHDLRALGRPGCAAAERDGRWRGRRMVGDGAAAAGSSSTARGDPDGWWAVVGAAAWAHLDDDRRRRSTCRT